MQLPITHTVGAPMWPIYSLIVRNNSLDQNQQNCWHLLNSHYHKFESGHQILSHAQSDWCVHLKADRIIKLHFCFIFLIPTNLQIPKRSLLHSKFKLKKMSGTIFWSIQNHQIVTFLLLILPIVAVKEDILLSIPLFDSPILKIGPSF